MTKWRVPGRIVLLLFARTDMKIVCVTIFCHPQRGLLPLPTPAAAEGSTSQRTPMSAARAARTTSAHQQDVSSGSRQAAQTLSLLLATTAGPVSLCHRDCNVLITNLLSFFVAWTGRLIFLGHTSSLKWDVSYFLQIVLLLNVRFE